MEDLLKTFEKSAIDKSKQVIQKFRENSVDNAQCMFVKAVKGKYPKKLYDVRNPIINKLWDVSLLCFRWEISLCGEEQT